MSRSRILPNRDFESNSCNNALILVPIREEIVFVCLDTSARSDGEPSAEDREKNMDLARQEMADSSAPWLSLGYP